MLTKQTPGAQKAAQKFTKSYAQKIAEKFHDHNIYGGDQLDFWGFFANLGFLPPSKSETTEAPKLIKKPMDDDSERSASNEAMSLDFRSFFGYEMHLDAKSNTLSIKFTDSKTGLCENFVFPKIDQDPESSENLTLLLDFPGNRQQILVKKADFRTMLCSFYIFHSSCRPPQQDIDHYYEADECWKNRLARAHADDDSKKISDCLGLYPFALVRPVVKTLKVDNKPNTFARYEPALGLKTRLALELRWDENGEVQEAQILKCKITKEQLQRNHIEIKGHGDEALELKFSTKIGDLLYECLYTDFLNELYALGPIKN